MKKEKTPKDYYFYCTVCGEPFQARRYDARTDSDECRLALSLITRELKVRQFSSDKTITPEQKELINSQVESATGTGRVLKKVLKSGNKTIDKKEEIKPELTPEKPIENKDLSNEKKV
jgi:hypothetical protein